MAYWIKIVACWILVSLAVSDLRFRRLPTIAVAGFAALYCAHAVFATTGTAALGAHAAAGGIAFAVAALLFAFGWIAGGDAKLAAAVFFWAGPTHAAEVFFIVSVCGLMVALAMLAAGAVLRHASHAPRWLSWLAPARGVPYGVALASGGVAAIWFVHQAPPA